MRVNEYHQPEDMEIAKANGIGYDVAYKRIYDYGWTIKRAITEPVHHHKDSFWHQYRDSCKAHNVSQNMFYQRIYAGWTIEQASTLPLGSKVKKRKPMLHKSLFELAREKGISKYTLHARVHRYGWSVEKALNTPVNEKYRRKS